jgi:ATP-dependent Clp protease ATP-binding subunit ClpC
MILALREAQDHHQEKVCTEHLLLGLTNQADSLASKVLKQLGVNLQALHLEVQRNTPSNPDTGMAGALPTPSVKGALMYATEEARGLGHDAVDTGHLLLGLMRDPDGVAGRILLGTGLSPEIVRQELTGHDYDL